MTRPSINEIIGLQDFAVLYRWEVIFPQLPNALANKGSYPSGQLDARAYSSEYPKFSNDEIETTLHGHKVYQALLIFSYKDEVITLDFPIL